MTSSTDTSRFTAAPMIIQNLGFFVLLFGQSGCLNQNPDQDASVIRVEPTPLVPGGEFTVQGYGLGERGIVRIAGVACPVLAWTNETILGVIPIGVSPGNTLLSIEPKDIGLTTHPVEIAGQVRQRLDAGVASVRPDGGLQTSQDTDSGGLERPDSNNGTVAVADATVPIDQDVKPSLTAEYSPDPVVNEAVRMSGRINAPGFIFLTVHVDDAINMGGVAFHLVYDSGLLAFEVADKEVGPRFQAKEIAPGRLAIGWVRSPNQVQSLSLRFRLVGQGEGRIEIPVRHRTVRDSKNQPYSDIRWTTGSVRITRVR